MAARTGLSKSTIGRIWRKFGLKPHLQDSFKLSTDPLFVENAPIPENPDPHPRGGHRANVTCNGAHPI